jgi:hypothetical protein
MRISDLTMGGIRRKCVNPDYKDKFVTEFYAFQSYL